MEFIALDFETADFTKYSPCEIGLTFVKDFQIVDKKSFLIKPYCYPDFDQFNISLHGITPKMVKDCPTFEKLYNNELKILLENQLIICHNSSFDLGVLKETLHQYDVDLPVLKYLCTLTLSRRLINSLVSYNLSNVANYFQINPYLSNHRALLDSEIAAKIAIELFKKYNVNTLEDIGTKLNYNIGTLNNDAYSGFTHKRKYVNIYERLKDQNNVIDETEFDSNSVFYKKNIVFTGKMSSMTRIEAAKIVLSLGGYFSDNLSSSTDILIVGQQDIRFVGEDGESRKQKEAQKLKNKGHNIEVLSELDFLQNINV